MIGSCPSEAFNTLRPVNWPHPSSPLPSFLDGHAFLLRSTRYNFIVRILLVQLRKRLDLSTIHEILNFSTEL